MGKKRNTISRDELLRLPALEVYKCLLDKDIAKFPDGFVTRENMKEIIRHVILNKLKLTRDEICKYISYEYLAKYKLRGSRRVFDDNVFELVTYCFPEHDIKNWELNKVRNGFWAEEKNRLEYMRWLIKRENINPKNISDLKRINAVLLDENLGRKAREHSGGIFNLILLVAEVDVREWQVMNIFKWSDEKAIEAVKWLVEEKLKWSQSEVGEKITLSTFYMNDLGSLMQNYFKNNVIKALNLAYPGNFKRDSSNNIQLA